MKGIVLAAGSGTRLYPVTLGTSKPLLPIYDKPMIFYPISLLMSAGIREIMLIVSPGDKDKYEALFGDGSEFGIDLTYGIQERPEGIAQALIIAEEFIGSDSLALVLGDNILYGDDLEEKLISASRDAANGKATVFGYYVDDPRAFGVVGFDEDDRPVSLTEKPSEPESNYAVIGVYFYDGRAPEIAKNLEPSARGELEITDVNRAYLDSGSLEVQKLSKDTVWFDTGTFDDLISAANAVKDKESSSGRIIACLEEIALRNGWLNKDSVGASAKKMSKTIYGKYLAKITDADVQDHLR